MVPRSGSHRIDNTQKHRQRFGAGGRGGGRPVDIWAYSFEGLTDCDSAIS